MSPGSTPRLPRIPLWQGAAYRLVLGDSSGNEVPVRLILASVVSLPRTHIFEHLGTSEEYSVQEREAGRFYMDQREIAVEFA